MKRPSRLPPLAVAVSLVVASGIAAVAVIEHVGARTAVGVESHAGRGAAHSGPRRSVATLAPAACAKRAPSSEALGSRLTTPAWETAPPGPLDGRFEASVVWTGREVIVWGGEHGPDGPPQSTGAAYDPVASTWRQIADAPIAPRSAHVAVWSGSEMFVWGGGEGGHHPEDAAAYDPATDSWRVTPPAPIPTRGSASAIWTGSEVLIWGGYLQGIFPAVDGAAYSPCTDSWRPLPPFPLEGRRQPLMVWTGNEAILWGGKNRNNWPWKDGAAFNPATNQWRALPPIEILGYPEPSGGWSGSEMIVWGWSNLAQGRARNNQTVAYDPAANSWRHLPPAPLIPTALENAGIGPGATAVWAGDELLVWTAGLDSEGPLVLSIDPYRDQWNRLPRAPETLTSVQSSPPTWTGTELFVPGAGPDRRSLLLHVRQRPPRMTG